MKKPLILLFVLLSFLSHSLSFAVSLDDVRLLIGATIGGADRDDDGSIDLTRVAQTPGVPQSAVAIGAKSAHSVDLNDGGVLWGGFAGAELFVEDFLLGLEIHVEEHNYNKGHGFAFTDNLGITPTTPPVLPPFASAYFGHSGEIDYQRGTVLGATVRAGYKIADWLIGYGRFGVEFSRDKLRYNSSYLMNSPSFTAFEQGERTERLLAGLGMEFPISCFCSTRLEYVYTSRSNGVQASGLDQLNTYNFAVSAKPNQHAIKASIALHTW